MTEAIQFLKRKENQTLKYDKFPGAELALWVADMDVAPPKRVRDWLTDWMARRDMGYGLIPSLYNERLSAYYQTKHELEIAPDCFVQMPGVVAVIHLLMQYLAERRPNVQKRYFTMTPIYPPFLQAGTIRGWECLSADLKASYSDAAMDYSIDFEAVEAELKKGVDLFLLCHPHNPSGRQWRHDELSKLLDLCKKYDCFLLSDEIWCDWGFARKHQSLLSLFPEMADRCITVHAASKTYNVPGLNSAFCFSSDRKLIQSFQGFCRGLIPYGTLPGQMATAEAFHPDNDPWLASIKDHVAKQRNALLDYFQVHKLGIPVSSAESTYLVWMDFSKYREKMPLQKNLLKEQGLVLNDGADFGPSYSQFLRLNLACDSETLLEALERIKAFVRSH